MCRFSATQYWTLNIECVACFRQFPAFNLIIVFLQLQFFYMKNLEILMQFFTG